MTTTGMLIFTSFATKLHLALICVDQDVMFQNVGKLCSPKLDTLSNRSKLTISSFDVTAKNPQQISDVPSFKLMIPFA